MQHLRVEALADPVRVKRFIVCLVIDHARIFSAVRRRINIDPVDTAGKEHASLFAFEPYRIRIRIAQTDTVFESARHKTAF